MENLTEEQNTATQAEINAVVDAIQGKTVTQIEDGRPTVRNLPPNLQQEIENIVNNLFNR